MQESISAPRSSASTANTSSCFNSGPKSTTKTVLLTSGFCQEQRAAKPCATVCIDCWLRAGGECRAHSAGDNLSFTRKLHEQIQNSILRSEARNRSYVHLLCFMTSTKIYNLRLTSNCTPGSANNSKPNGISFGLYPLANRTS
jgi:hypothetical protein